MEIEDRNLPVNPFSPERRVHWRRETPLSEKGKMMEEMLGSLRGDPLGVQFLPQWFWSLLPRHGPLEDRLPWMNFRAIRWLDSYLRSDMDTFEFGAGGSTLFVARRVRRMTSIEHDRHWHGLVADALNAERVTNCDLRLVEAEPDPSAAEVPYGPASFSSLTPGARGLRFERYARAIDGQPDRSLDLVLVDGYARFSCVARAIPKVRPGGYLMFDDTDLKKYREAVTYLDRFRRTDFIGLTPFQRNLRQTTIWRL